MKKTNKKPKKSGLNQYDSEIGMNLDVIDHEFNTNCPQQVKITPGSRIIYSNLDWVLMQDGCGNVFGVTFKNNDFLVMNL